MTDNMTTESAPVQTATETGLDNSAVEAGVSEALKDLGADTSDFKFSEISENPDDKIVDEKVAKEEDDSEEDSFDKLKIDDEPEESEESDETEESEDPELELNVAGAKYKLPTSRVVELAQKGFDYTVKTQQLADERRANEREFTSKVQEIEQMKTQYEEDLSEKQQMDYFLSHLEQANPELHDMLKQELKQFQIHARNPIDEMRNNKLTREIAELKELVTSMTTQTKREEFNKEMNHMKSNVFPKYARYGIQPDEQRIVNEWVERGGTLEDSFKRIYGDHFMKVADAKSKVAQAKNSAKRVPTAGKVKSSKAVRKPNYRNVSYDQIAEGIASQLAG